MTDKTLKSLIDKLNKKKGLIFLKPLSPTVDQAKVWMKQPRPTDRIIYGDGPYNFYFIKDGNGLYVGIVLDMQQDLHWFILPKFRKQGHLINALKECILPNLFQTRDEQKITIDASIIGIKNFEASEKVALRLGFKKKEGSLIASEYLLPADGFSAPELFSMPQIMFSENRLKELQRQINFISRSLHLVQSEVEMQLDDYYSEELGRLARDIHSHIGRIEDVWFENRSYKSKL